MTNGLSDDEPKPSVTADGRTDERTDGQGINNITTPDIWRYSKVIVIIFVKTMYNKQYGGLKPCTFVQRNNVKTIPATHSSYPVVSLKTGYWKINQCNLDIKTTQIS